MKRALKLPAPAPGIFAPVDKEQKQEWWEKASPSAGSSRTPSSGSRQELVDPIVRITARNDVTSMSSGLSGVQTVVGLVEEIVATGGDKRTAARANGVTSGRRA